MISLAVLAGMKGSTIFKRENARLKAIRDRDLPYDVEDEE
jgi:hypothetical protein